MNSFILTGIAPIHDSGWNMLASVRFHELVGKKEEFCAVIVDASDSNVGVMLYDRSDDGDIDVGAVLVKEGLAIDVTTL